MRHNYPCLMSMDEAKIYFESEWYRDQIIKRREKLIRDGLITPKHNPRITCH